MTSTMNNIRAAALIVLALAIGVMAVYVAAMDDAPGAAFMGGLLMIGGVVLAVKTVRHRLPTWAAHTALVAGVLIAAFAALLAHDNFVRAPLFAQPQVPSVVDPAPPAQYAAAVERARELVRAAMLE